MHMTKRDRWTLCRECRSPKCTNPLCRTCQICRNVKCNAPGRCGMDIVAANPATLPKNQEERSNFLCPPCQPACCCVCGVQPRYAFTPSALHLKNALNTRCIDCSHPACSNSGCNTCQTCRAVSCRLGDLCKKTISPLTRQEQPQDLDEKHRFRCRHCRYPPCQTCKKPMPTGGCRQRFDKSRQVDWTCGDCLTLEESRKVHVSILSSFFRFDHVFSRPVL